MRILQVSSAGSIGGGETHVLELTDALRKRGHSVVLAGRRNGPLKPEIKLPFLNSADFISAFRLRRILKRESFDVVHAHVARDYTIVAGAAWGLPRPKVVFTRHLLYPVRKHRLYSRVDGWLAPTSQVLKTLEPLSPKTAAVIPNWVDTARFAYKVHPVHSPATVGLLGQISPHKGHDTAIEAIRQLGRGYRLLIAGKGSDTYVAVLKLLSAGLPVEFLGFVSLPDFFEMIDVLIVPSWEEPFGIVLLEAMSSGVPVIATNRGGPLEIIPTAMHGILIPPKDPNALASAIRTMATDDAVRSSIIKNAREQVERNFDIQVVVPRIEDFYRRVILTG